MQYACATIYLNMNIVILDLFLIILLLLYSKC